MRPYRARRRATIKRRRTYADNCGVDRRCLSFALISLVLACAACGRTDEAGRGAESDRPGQEQETLTRGQFIANAKAICTDPSKEIVPPGVQGPSPEEQLAIAMDVWSGVVRELRELEPPTGERTRVDRMLTNFENAIRAGREAFTAENESALAAVAGLFDQGSKGAAIARSYGLEVCSPVPVMPSAEELSENEAFQRAMLDRIRALEEGDLPAPTEP